MAVTEVLHMGIMVNRLTGSNLSISSNHFRFESSTQERDKTIYVLLYFIL